MTLSDIAEPMIVVGLGGAGARLASDAAKMLRCRSMCISNDESDLESSSMSMQNATVLHTGTGSVINPTIGLVRSAAYEKIESIREHISGNRTVLLVCNLAGKAGCGISPVIAKACAAEGANMISLAIMPFGYEKSRLFDAGVALRRLRESSACTIVLDNDSLLESNPDMTPKECYAIADAAVMSMTRALKDGKVGATDDSNKENILAASRDGVPFDMALRDALKMLHNSAHPESITQSMIYVSGGEGVPAGMLRTAARITEYILAGKKDTSAHNAAVRQSSVDVSTLPRHAGALQDASGKSAGIVMLSAVQGMEKFERYDPLGSIIPDDMVLDWDEPECSIDYYNDSIVPGPLRQLE